MGEHLHPPSLTSSHDSVKRAKAVIKEYVALPFANPGLSKNDVICELQVVMESDIVEDLTE